MGEDKGQSYASKFRLFTPPPPPYYSSTMDTYDPLETLTERLEAQRARIDGFQSLPQRQPQRPPPQEYFTPQPLNDMQVIGNMLAKILISFEEDEKNEQEMKQEIEDLNRRVEAIERENELMDKLLAEGNSSFSTKVQEDSSELDSTWYCKFTFDDKDDEGEAFSELDTSSYCKFTFDEEDDEERDSPELNGPSYYKFSFVDKDDEEKPLVIGTWPKDVHEESEVEPIGDERFPHLGVLLEYECNFPSEPPIEEVRNYAHEDLSEDFLGIQISTSLGEDDEEWLTPKSQFEDGNEGVSIKPWNGYEDPYFFMPYPSKFISFRAYLDIAIEGNLHDSLEPLEAYSSKRSVRLYDVHLKIGGRQFLWDFKID